ncbi:MAG: hypothetical protein R2748_17965 [Bryobacterales bacterium]
MPIDPLSGFSPPPAIPDIERPRRVEKTARDRDSARQAERERRRRDREERGLEQDPDEGGLSVEA